MKSDLAAEKSAKKDVVHNMLRLVALTAASLFVVAASAQGTIAKADIEYDLSVSAIHQPKTSIDGGGEFSLSGGIVKFGLKRSLGSGSSLGLGFNYEVDDYDFSGVTEFGGIDPWNDVRRFGISLPYFKILNDNWVMGLSPSVNWLQEYDADSDDSLSYGLTAFATRSYTRTRSLGLGVGIFQTIDDDTKVFPFIALDWKFNDQWRLSNPFDADALGPAGLELSYQFNDRWQLGGGGVYRSFEFRLDKEGVAPDGAGENKAAILFVRLRRLSPTGLNMDFYTGAAASGELKLNDEQGNSLASSDYDSAPFVAVTFSLEF